MKTFTIYKYLFLASLFLISVGAKAQCPFTASITTMDAGGCGNSNGSVFFTIQEETAGSIAGSFFLVYKADGTTLITSNTNTNPEVSLPAGNYVAEVIVQCIAGTQAPWRKNFVVKQTTESTDFKGEFNRYVSRLTTLNAFNSGILAYKFTGNGAPYTLDIIEYPSEYTGSVHFENIPNGDFQIKELAAGRYKVRMTNGCMTTTDGPREIFKAPYDMPKTIGQVSDVKNTQGGGINENRPTTDYYSLFASIYASGEPVDYTNDTNIKEFYEYTWIDAYGGEQITDQTSWFEIKNTVGRSNHIISKYSHGEMRADPAKKPMLYFRLKGTDLISTGVPIGLSGIGSNTLDRLVEHDKSNCDGNYVNLKIKAKSYGTFSYPLTLQVRANRDGNAVLGTYTVTEADMKADIDDYITIPNIDISKGFRTYYMCTGDPYPYEVSYEPYNLTSTSLEDLISLYKNTYMQAISCESNYNSFSIRSQIDLRGAKIKYVGDIPLTSDYPLEFTIPADFGTPTLNIYMTPPDGTHPWNSPSSKYIYAPPGEYTWEISLPCGSGYKIINKKVTILPPEQIVGNPSKFNPQIVSTTECGGVEILLGEFNNLKDIFTAIPYNRNTFLSLTKKDFLSSVIPNSENYTPLGNASGVYYDGNHNYGFETSAANAIYTHPKIRVTQPGTYYVVAIAGASSSSVTVTENSSCVLLKEFVITEGDLKGKIDMNTSGAYFCAQDGSTGVVFVQREGIDTGNDFTFKIRNRDNSPVPYSKTITTANPQVVFDDINVDSHGTQFTISVEPVGNCSTTPSVAVLNLNEINNSATFITQDIESDCNGTVDIIITGNAYIGASYKWTDSAGNVLSSTNRLAGKFATGTKLYLDVLFVSKGPGGVDVPCGSWTKEYTVKGIGFTGFYWRSNAVDSNWNNPQNWNKEDGTRANAIPGICSDVIIPATVKNYYPDLGQAIPEPKVSHIEFQFGGQLYNQHKLTYDHAYISYNFGYYENLATPAPNNLIQPTHSVAEVTACADYKTAVAFSNLPIMKRARWYMLSAPIKGMYMGDFQLAGKPYMVQRTYKNITPTAEILVQDGFAVTSASDEPLSATNNSVSIWTPPYGKAIGAEDQKVLENLKGTIVYPYFPPFLSDDAIMNARLDVTYDKATRTQNFKQFELATLNLSNSKSVTRLVNSSRFIYEDDATNAIPADETFVLSITGDSKRTNGEVMIGNPYMAPIDFDKFIAANAGVIKTIYKIIVDGETKTYNQSNPADPNGISKFIAAQQSFIITLSNPTAAATLKFPVSTIATQDSITIKTKVL